MARNHSLTKRKRRPKRADRVDYTTKTMAQLKALEEAGKQ